MLGIFLDTETNGLNPFKHSLLEIAYKIIDVGTGALIAEFETVVHQSDEVWNKSDPESLKVNGFTHEKLQTGRPAHEVAREIIEAFTLLGVKRHQAIFICQNPSFDRAFFSQLIDPDLQEALNWPYHWLDLASMYWAESIRQKTRYPWETGVSKDRIAATYRLPSEARPHRAINGVNHLLLCYEAVVGFPLGKNPS